VSDGSTVSPSDPVLRVNKVTITLGAYLRHFRLQILLDRNLSARERVTTVPFTLLETLVTEELIRQSARALAVQVSPETLERELARQTGGASSGSEQDPLQHLLALTGMTLAEYRSVVRAGLVEEEVERRLGPHSPHAGCTELQVRVERLDRNGVPLSDAVECKLEWTPVCLFPAELRPSLDDLRPGQQTSPLTAPCGRVILGCIERRASTGHIPASHAFEQWLAVQEALNTIERIFDSARYAWLMEGVDDLLLALSESKSLASASDHPVPAEMAS
jgi:hypothetical protein